MADEQKIREYCEQNKGFQDLMALFTKNYSDGYNALKVKDRKRVKIYLKRNFGHWYYSDITMVEVSPACIINSEVHRKLDKNVMVYPLCKPVYRRDKLIDITYEFNVFKTDAHPFTKDMKAYLDALEDMEFYVEKEKRLKIDTEEALRVTSAEGLGLAFEEAAYLEVIADLCAYLGLADIAELSGSDKKKRFIANQAKIHDFFALPARVQLEKIVDANVNIFIEYLENFYESNQLTYKVPTADQIYEALGNGMHVDNLLEAFFKDLLDSIGCDLNEIGNFFSKFEDMDDDLDDWDIDGERGLEQLQAIYDGKIEQIVIAKFVSSILERCFFLVFGQYLQLIQPLRYDFYDFGCDREFLDSDNDNDNVMNVFSAFNIYMIAPDAYKLSPLGVELFRDGEPEDDPIFDDVDPDEYEDLLEETLNWDEQDDKYDNVIDFSDFFSDFSSEKIPSTRKTPKSSDKLKVLEGLNPSNLPVWDSPDACYRFKVKVYNNKRNYQIIEAGGSETLKDLAIKIQGTFALDSMHMYSFYMGKKFYERGREITTPDYDEGGDINASHFRICELGLYKKQKFLFLHDFGAEERFEIEFMG